MSYRHLLLTVVSVGMLAAALPAQEQADKQPPAVDEETLAKLRMLQEMGRAAEAQRDARRLCEKGAKFLIATQEKDGGWASDTGPGITALAARALAQEPGIGPDHPAVQRALDFIFTFQHDDGGIYAADGLHKNYETAVTLGMLSAIKSEKHAERVKKLQEFLIKGQWDEGEDISTDDVFYGGAGYGRHKRPDLSNTQLMLEALHDSGLPKDHPTYKKALIFIQRCQMRGESNDQSFAEGSTQGGFIYSPANDGESKAGKTVTDGRTELRAYGSMTYAGMKSMVYAGLTADDPRVRAALDWIKQHWTLEQNPNMPDETRLQGLFYYYHTFARALDASGLKHVEDAGGERHHWRSELVSVLKARQRDDGSWVNEADRWMEGVPALVTAYSMLALQAAYPAGQ